MALNIHRTQGQISRQSGISLASVNRIIKSEKRRAHDLTEAIKIVRRDRCPNNTIDTAVGEWRKSLRACVHNVIYFR